VCGRALLRVLHDLTPPLSPLLSPRRAALNGAAFFLILFPFFHAPTSKERESTACFSFPLTGLAHCQEHQEHQERAQQDKRFYVLFSGCDGFPILWDWKNFSRI
jgi:hypothetical protein